MRTWRVLLSAAGTIGGISLLWAGCTDSGDDNVHCEIKHQGELVACYHAGTSELHCGSAYGTDAEDPFQYITGTGDCPAGEALSCADADHTEFYYDANDGHTCAQYESHEAAVFGTAYTCKVYEATVNNIQGDLVACFSSTQEFTQTECTSTKADPTTDTRVYVFEVGTCPLTDPAAMLICPAQESDEAEHGVHYIYTSTAQAGATAVTCATLYGNQATHEGT